MEMVHFYPGNPDLIEAVGNVAKAGSTPPSVMSESQYSDEPKQSSSHAGPSTDIGRSKDSRGPAKPSRGTAIDRLTTIDSIESKSRKRSFEEHSTDMEVDINGIRSVSLIKSRDKRFASSELPHAYAGTRGQGSTHHGANGTTSTLHSHHHPHETHSSPPATTHQSSRHLSMVADRNVEHGSSSVSTPRHDRVSPKRPREEQSIPGRHRQPSESDLHLTSPLLPTILPVPGEDGWKRPPAILPANPPLRRSMSGTLGEPDFHSSRFIQPPPGMPRLVSPPSLPRRTR